MEEEQPSRSPEPQMQVVVTDIKIPLGRWVDIIFTLTIAAVPVYLVFGGVAAVIVWFLSR